ncbi:GGDEF domain-containing protein [Demequina lutea]|uniref:Diguanylate cyclase (GGDEF)-like protein n=1 Tax=Demequina lutea TaxID=431489 RepID=A0A7Z0CJU4_9MICO|nr:GGDEF domain-containing protein [Demequina lutea]NYI41147.1 diguanylate cyclase (GGDEF)-like protein [Demequina lutea]
MVKVRASEPTSSPGATRGPSIWRDGLLMGLGALIVGCLIGYGLDFGSWASQVAALWVLVLFMHIMLVLTAGRVARADGATTATRRVWGALSLAGAAYAVGDGIQMVALAINPIRGAEPTMAWLTPGQSMSIMVGTTIVVVVMLTTPTGLVSRRDRTRFWLDVSVVMAAATTFGGYVYLSEDASTFTGVLFSMLAGPGAFLVGAFSVVRLVLSERSPFSALAGRTLVAAAVLQGTVQASSVLMIQSGRLSWYLGLAAIASTLLLASARIQQLQVRADPNFMHARPQRRFSKLPYVAIAATYLLLVWVLREVGLDVHMWIVVCGAIASTGLVIVRQLAAFADNAHLLDELDATVDQLRQSLGERELLTAELRHQAFHDPLTGLSNRAMLGNRLELALNAVGIVANRRALMIVDLDDFKAVNDVFGHAVGDELLIVAARRLRDCVRGSDLVARVGGDEFAVLLDNPQDGTDEIAQRIVDAMAKPFMVSAGTASVSASVGVVVFDGVGRTAEELLHEADTSMYQAKREGKGEYRICA